MDILDIFLNKYSYKFLKGYPDMNNEQDVLLMESLLSELGINELDFKNTSPDTQYDEIIKKKLNVDKIPQVIEEYKLGTVKSLNKKDAEIFSKLYGESPPTKNNSIEDGGSKGVGNGEISMYWLFRHQKTGHIVADSRGGSNPDLTIDGKGIEIKGQKDNNFLKIGRIGEYTKSLNDLNTVLGIDALISNFEASGNKKTPPNAFNVDNEELIKACENVINIYNNDNLKKTGKDFKLEFINSMYLKLDVLNKKYEDIFHDKNKLAAGLFKSFISQKLEKKPGYPGYIVTVLKTGPTKYIKITDDAVKNLSDKDILTNAKLAQGSLTFKADLFKEE